MYAKLIKELKEMEGGVSSPMSTLFNTPATGTAQPASTAATTGAQQTSDSAKGSGDKWDASIGKPHTQETNESFRSKEFKGMRGWVDDWFAEHKNEVKFYTHTRENGKKISGFLMDVYPHDYYTEPDVENPYNKQPYSKPVELFFIPLFKEGMFKIVDLNKGTVLKDKMRVKYESDWEELGLVTGGWDGPVVFENNISPYDKIGMMMAKKMGVEPPFKQKDYRTNTVVQNQWEELDEEQPDNTQSIDDYVSNPDKVMNTAKKRKLKVNEERYTIETLDNYIKASRHVPDHPLTLVKKQMIKEEDLRTEEVTKDVKAKDALEQLGIAYEYKEAKSGKKRTFIKEPMKNVLDTLKEGGWEEYGKNPENTIRKYLKGDKVLTIFADGKDLPRATLTPKDQEEAKEHLVVRKVVPGSINPYLKP